MDLVHCFVLTIPTLCFWNRIIPCPQAGSQVDVSSLAPRLRIALFVEPDIETDCRGLKLVFNPRLVTNMVPKTWCLLFLLLDNGKIHKVNDSMCRLKTLLDDLKKKILI
jgi:hypothetical protein